MFCTSPSLRAASKVIVLTAVSLTAMGVSAGTAGAKVELGVNAGPHVSTQTLREIAATGAKHVRVQFSWSEAQPARATYDWSKLDEDMTASATAKITLDAVVNSTPAWAVTASTPLGIVDSYPANINDLTNWVKEAAKRYGSKGTFWKSHPQLTPRPVKLWQIWNEPNASSFWTGGVANPKLYASILLKSRTAVLQADPKASFEAAGVAGSGGEGDMAPDLFLKLVWKALGRSAALFQWDMHAYSDTPEHAAAILPYMRWLMDRNGCRGCSFRVGEWGWTSGELATGPYTFLCAGGEQRQASFASKFLSLAFAGATKNKVLALTWFRWDEPDSGYCFTKQGLLGPSGPKPVLAVFSSYARR
jgi:hypothetical protein